MHDAPYRPLLARIILVYLALQSIQIGLWAMLAPRSFYDNFPGLGRSWVAVDGPYNEHLIRDVGALNVSLVILLIAAAITLSRQLLITAALATLAWGVPHLTYHIINTDGLSNSDIAASLTGLAIFAALPLVLIAGALKSGRQTKPEPASAPAEV